MFFCDSGAYSARLQLSRAAARHAADRGRAGYRVSLAGAEMIVIPGLTDGGEVDLSSLRGTLALTRNYG